MSTQASGKKPDEIGGKLQTVLSTMLGVSEVLEKGGHRMGYSSNGLITWFSSVTRSSHSWDAQLVRVYHDGSSREASAARPLGS
jgi:hypothetical protein